MYKYIILAIALLSFISTSNAQCRAGWTGYDCSVCTVQNNTCGCETSMNFQAGKYFSCNSTKTIDIPIIKTDSEPGITFACGANTCYLSLYNSDSYKDYGDQEAKIQCKLTGCEYNKLEAQCSDMVCDCRSCGTIVYGLVTTIRGKSSISCDRNGNCNYNGPTTLNNIINMNPVNLQCIAGSCENPPTDMTPSIQSCNTSDVSSLLPFVSLSVILSLLSLLF